MNVRKLCIGALCCCTIISGVNYLLRQYASPDSGSEVWDTADGAAQYVGRHDIKNSPYFAQPDIYNMQPNEHLLLLQKYPTLQQSTGYSCGPIAAATVVKYFTGRLLHTEAEICRYMSTSSATGTTTKGMVSYFSKLGWDVHSADSDKTPDSYEDFQEFVRKNLQNNTPIMVENIDWGGHWRVIIGYDTMGTAHGGDDVLIMADPFDTSDHLQDGYNIVSAERFFYMWFDHQLFSKSEQTRPWLTAKPK